MSVRLIDKAKKALFHMVPFSPVAARKSYLPLLSQVDAVTPDADPPPNTRALLGDNDNSNSGNRQIALNKQEEITTTQGLLDHQCLWRPSER